MATEPSAELPDLPKLPFRRLKLAVEQVVTIAIPRHIRILNDHSARIHELQRQHKHLKLSSGQLELSSEQVRDESELNLEQIKLSLEQIVSELSSGQLESGSEQLRESELNLAQLLELRSKHLELISEQLESGSEQFRESKLNQLLELRSKHLELSSRQLRESELRSERLRAAIAVRWLKQDLFELENLFRQVREEDQDLFCGSIRGSLRDAMDMLSAFMQLHSDVMDNDESLLSAT